MNIICGLDRINKPPLYWVINQNMYDTSNLPYIFKTTVYGILTLETINRRMDDWQIQCVRVTSNKELIRGPTTTFRVIYGMHLIMAGSLGMRLAEERCVKCYYRNWKSVSLNWQF